MKKTSSINAAQHPPASNLHLEKVDAVGSVGVTRLHSYQHGSDLPLLIKPLRFPPPHSDAEVADRKHITEQSGVANETQLSDSDDDTIVDNAKYELLAKANQFTLSIDPDRGYRGTQLDFWRFDRPHMRAFHASWACQFASSFGMFSQAPLLAEIQHSLHLSKSDIWWTNLWMMIGGIPVRFLLGATCDSEGARTTMTYVVAGSAIPCILTGFIATNLTRLTIARTFLGALDAFVPGQYWITSMFVREVSGTAMAITGGLGASGSGITQLVMGSFVFPLMLNLTHGDKEWAWRWALVVPAALALLVSWFFYHNSDDCPLGQVTEVKKAGLMIQRSAAASFRAGIYNMNSWILFLQFAGSCGVDFTMCNGAAIYFHYQFNQSIAAAGAFAFLYGVSAIFARGLGGWISDQMGDQYSFKGRLYSQLISMTTQGLCNIWFARTQTLESSLFIMILFSIFVQMSMGTCFGIVVSHVPRSVPTLHKLSDPSHRDSPMWMARTQDQLQVSWEREVMLELPF